MTRFIDVYAPEGMPSFPCYSGPRFSHRIVVVDSGDEQVTPRWTYPLQQYTMPSCVRDYPMYCAVRDHWYVTEGPGKTWPFSDPLDHASVDHLFDGGETVADISELDQEIAVGDGFSTEFQLIKTYTRGGYSKTRKIVLPIPNSVTAAVDGVLLPNADYLPSLYAYVVGDKTTFLGRNFICIQDHESEATTWPGVGPTWEDYWIEGGGPFEVSRPGGIITFDEAPEEGAIITVGYLFDVEVRYENDNTFEGIFQTTGVAGYADIKLVEVRHCAEESAPG